MRSLFMSVAVGFGLLMAVTSIGVAQPSGCPTLPYPPCNEQNTGCGVTTNWTPIIA
jgi:hypothetical protein